MEIKHEYNITVEIKHEYNITVEIKHEYNITVEITNIDVSKEYYSFDYAISGAVAGSGNYESSYQNGNTPEEQYEWLIDGGAANLALLQEVE